MSDAHTIAASLSRDAIRRPLCPDPKPMTRPRILAIARTQGAFGVTWHYRNDTLRKVCGRMQRDGLLRRRRCAPGSTEYVLTDLGRAVCDALKEDRPNA